MERCTHCGEIIIETKAYPRPDGKVDVAPNYCIIDGKKYCLQCSYTGKTNPKARE